MKKAVGYIRYGKGRSDERRQRKAIEEYCRTNDLIIDGWLGKDAEDFGDIAYGNWMGHKRIDVVVAATNGDVTDSVFKFFAYRCKLMMRSSGLEVAEWTDYAGYRMQLNALDELTKTIYKEEVEHDPVRMANGRARKARRGGYIGGNAPMGYKVVNGMLEVNQDEVAVVKFIMDEKHAGRTKTGTMEKLNANGYRNRSGREFTIGTVQGIWNNKKFYQGYYRIKGTDEWVKGQHEAIIKE